MSHHNYTKTKTVQNKTLTADSVILQKQKQKHLPVMPDEVVQILSPKIGERYLDLTAGYGGHAERMIQHTKSEPTLIDRDTHAVEHLSQKFPKATLLHKDYAAACEKLRADGEQFDIILADIGVSSPHVDEPSRGFSFMSEGPLDMRMDQSTGLTAAEVLNTYSESDIADILYKYGQERRSRKIAAEIVNSRPLTTTTELAELVARVKPRGKSKIHPSTLVFQALRIYVNDEIGQLGSLLDIAPKLLSPGGRLAIITFHSIEDALVKSHFKEIAGNTLDAEYTLLTPKPLVPSAQEIAFNPRARSAKLRALQQK